jgi:uncharacterized protein (DUF305 family)
MEFIKAHARHAIASVGLLCLGVMVGIYLLTWAVNTRNTALLSFFGAQLPETQVVQKTVLSMDDMVQDLRGRRGADFDRAFLASMVAHHASGVDMANLALSRAEHVDIKNLSDDIITVQMREVDQMRAWQRAWGYRTGMMGH